MRIRFIPATDTHELRRLVLRNGDPSAVVIWPGDENVDSFHLGAFLGDHCIGVASFQPEGNGQLNGKRPFRLRGMATLPEHQGTGVGTGLLRSAIDHLRGLEADVLWCNAREVALRFYERAGFRVTGVPFMVEGIGIHHLMFILL